MRNTKKGFTLVELLVVIAILAILATVSVVGYTNYIKNANESLALQELSQVKSSILAEDIVNNNFAIGSDGKVNAEGVAKFNEYLAGLATDLNGNLEYVDGTVVYTLEKDTSVVYVLDLKTGEVEAGTATQTPVTPPATPVETLAFEILPGQFNKTSYANNNNEKTVGDYKYTSNQVMLKNNEDVIQWKKNEGTITVSETYASGIVKIKITSTAGTYVVTVGGTTVSGTTEGNVTTFDLTDKTGEITIECTEATGYATSVQFYK